MSAIEQPRGEIGEDDGLFGRGEDVAAFGHEVDTAEDDVVGLGVLGGLLSKLERVAAEVGEFDDVVALVVMSEDEESVAEFLSGCADTFT